MKKSVKDSIGWMANYVFWHAVIGAVAVVGGLKFMDIDLTNTLGDAAHKCANAGTAQQKGRCMADFMNANPPLMLDRPEEITLNVSGDEITLASVSQQICAPRKSGGASIFGAVDCRRQTVYYPSHR